MKLLDRRGQSIGEYAILLGIVLGAVFAVQSYVRNRIAGGVMAQADTYLTQASDGAVAAEGFQVTSDSISNTELDFTTAAVGTVHTDSVGRSRTVNPVNPQ